MNAQADRAGTAAVSLEAVRKAFAGGRVSAVGGVTLGVNAGETLAVLGPSGCGKSTLLRLIAGLERPDAGRVRLGGLDVTDLPPERRGVGLVFQDGALFPHRDVAGNVAYGLEEQRLPRGEVRARVALALERVRIEALAGRRIAALSGGERQRVALARALAPEPRVLLLDEPFSSLDEALRADLRPELAALFADLGLTAVLVTHDQRDAFALADRVAVMRAGRVVQVGSPRAVFAAPADAWTARFLGHRNVLERDEAARLGLPCQEGECLIVPDAAIALEPTGGERATVRESVFEGHRQRLTLELRGVRLLLDSAPETRSGEPKPGDGVTVRLLPQATRAVPA